MVPESLAWSVGVGVGGGGGPRMISLWNAMQTGRAARPKPIFEKSVSDLTLGIKGVAESLRRGWMVCASGIVSYCTTISAVYCKTHPLSLLLFIRKWPRTIGVRDRDRDWHTDRETDREDCRENQNQTIYCPSTSLQGNLSYGAQ